MLAQAEFEQWRQEREEEQKKREAEEDKGLRRNPVRRPPDEGLARTGRRQGAGPKNSWRSRLH